VVDLVPPQPVDAKSAFDAVKGVDGGRAAGVAVALECASLLA
jgi:hypothetical protein